MKRLALISCPGSQRHEGRLLEFADWMGVPTRHVTVGDGPAIDRLVRELGSSECLAISVETLTFLRKLASPDVLRDFIENRCAKLLVFSVGHSQHHQDGVTWLTNSAVGGPASPEARHIFHMPVGGRRFSRCFAGQSFSMKRPVAVATFDLGDAAGRGIDQILLADDRPVLLRTERGSCEVFLLALAQLPDLSAQLSASTGLEDCYDQIIPILIVLRHCFAEMCWHGPESTARLIIDDPLLTQTYGFLNYEALQESMRLAGYGTSIAFIPWNYWRTSKEGATRIFEHKANLSICVHGCDHTNREFAQLDLGSLQWKADTALRRMERHTSRTGLAFDPIMVFPQGKFASSAMLALRSNGYLAAVNTTCHPTNAGAEPLTIADLLRPAITKFHGFPLFPRRYPRRLIDFAFDIFLGRPVLLVQHHEDFRDGYQQLEEFVESLHELEPKLSWEGLACQLMRSCMMRSLSEHSMEVRFFTGHFRFKNPRSSRAGLTFSKEEPDVSAISRVVVDGTSVPFALENGLLTFEHHAEAGQVIDIRVLDEPRPRVPAAQPMTQAVGVPVRRALSEFRDNTLIKYPRLFTAATALTAKMKRTRKGDRH